VKRSLALSLLLLSTVALDAGCDGPPVEARLLVVDGIEIRVADVEPYVAFLDTIVPEGGRKTKIMRALEEHLIPLRLAQRAFAAERRTMFERASALAAVAGNIAELERHAQLVETKRRSTMTRMQAQLPVAMQLFDPLRVGAVGPPIEVPQGWFVAAAYDLVESPGLVLEDVVDALQVAFVTHTAAQWSEWIEAQRLAIADKVTFLHPDYQGVLPAWLRAPRSP
jgi:hypothetical protein